MHGTARCEAVNKIFMDIIANTDPYMKQIAPRALSLVCALVQFNFLSRLPQRWRNLDSVKSGYVEFKPPMSPVVNCCDHSYKK
jgi:hypothetical protein